MPACIRFSEAKTNSSCACVSKLRPEFHIEDRIKALSAVLSQRQEDNQLHPVAFASRALSAAEKNYSITELETLAVVWEYSTTIPTCMVMR